ncbi:MAG: hypothetical protein LH470_07880 [Lysobacter sp.]|nr:hypothetical protein [Lysobacter sp.]
MAESEPRHKSRRHGRHAPPASCGGEAHIAYSSGPALYEDLTPGAKPRFMLGAFQSVWQRGDDGVWRMLFDDGVEPKAAAKRTSLPFTRGVAAPARKPESAA